MKRAHMLGLTGPPKTHDGDAPKDWHDVPNVTGDFDLDATILHRDNPNLKDRLALYCKHTNSIAYGPRTGYNGYHNYGGDT